MLKKAIIYHCRASSFLPTVMASSLKLKNVVVVSASALIVCASALVFCASALVVGDSAIVAFVVVAVGLLVVVQL